MESRTLNDFLPQLPTQDTKKKLQLGQEIVNYLGDPKNSLETDDMAGFIDGVVTWLNSSNFKVCFYGLEILGFVVDRMKDDFRPYISVAFSGTIDRLGDNKDQVREQAQTLIQKLMETVSTPQHIFDKLLGAFSHKSWRVREEVMLCLQKTLELYGANSLALSKVVPSIVKLLSDPTAQVRDTAANTLVEIYRHVGERVRVDLQKKYNLPANKVQAIMAKFDDVRDSGTMMSTASAPTIHAETVPEDEVDKAVAGVSKSTPPKRASSAPPVRRVLLSSKMPYTTAQAGAVDEETFMRSFEEVPKVQLFSAKDLEDGLQKCREILCNASNDWEKRIESLKRVRSYIVAGGAEYDELYPQLRQLEHAFQLSVKDLRSQVVREAAITIAFLSQQLGQKMDHFAEALLVNLINLIPNSAKIMSTSGVVAVRYIIRYTHASRLIPLITSNMNSKSKDIRRACCEFLDQLLHTWPTHTLERHIANIQDAIKKGIGDADPDARAFSRRAFWGFAEHFSEQAESLLNSLDSAKQKMLQSQMSLSNSSSNNSLNNSLKHSRSQASSARGSTENLSRIPSFSMKRSGIPTLSPRNEADGSRLPNGSVSFALRSNSAIDLNAVQRARARATYAAAARLKVGSGASLPRPRKLLSASDHSSAAGAVNSPERLGRSRSKVGVSQSQPSSRSGSPSSRLSYATYSSHVPDSATGTRTRRRVGVAHSTGTSRETSPTRSLYTVHDRHLTGSGTQKRTRGYMGGGQLSQGGRGLLTQKILTQTKETEAAVADALGSPRKRFDTFGNESDDSETSSVCSERSYGSYGRPIDDVTDIINNLASQHWADRKEGLVGLQALIKSQRTLTTAELKRITDIFTKMFMEPHTKLLSILLDTLQDLIVVHKADIGEWLYVMMSKIFMRSGGDLLGSIQTKIQKTLDIIRETFSLEQQFGVVMRFLIDHVQTPNSKAKLTVMNFLHVLCQIMNASDFTVTTDSQAAITKIITWTSDPKSSEIRRASQSVVIALFNLNSPEFTKLLANLSKNSQDNATRLLHNHLRRGSADDSLKASPVAGSLKVHSPNTPLNRVRPLRSLEYDDTENLNPEEVYNSLRKTTTEIQNYSFDAIDNTLSKSKFEKDRDTTSQDSGISQMSAADGRVDMLEESPETGSPTHRREYNASLYQENTNRNGYERSNYYDGDSDSTVVDSGSTLPGDSNQDWSATFSSIISELSNQNTRYEERKSALSQLAKLSREGCSSKWNEHFKAVFRVVLGTLKDDDGNMRAQALRTLSELLRRQSAHFHSYAELTILKILAAHRDSEKEVVRAAEVCAVTLAGSLPAELCIRSLNPIIQTGEYPVNQAAIKMLTKVIDQQSKQVVMQHIQQIMPGLIQAYDNTESSVRKAAVFCMVAAHMRIGEELQPYLHELNGSKLKLLNLYIKRAQTQTSLPQSSSPTSPLHSSSAGSSQNASPRS